MSTCNWKDFIGYLVAATSSSSDTDHFIRPHKGLLLAELKNAAHSFFNESKVSRRIIHIDTQCGVKDYPLRANDCNSIIAINTVYHDEELISDDYLLDEDDQSIVFDEPFCEDKRWGLKINASVNYDFQSDPCQELPPEACTIYRDAIINKTLASVYAMPQQDWADASMVLYHDNKYEKALKKIRTEQLLKYRSKQGSMFNIKVRGFL